MQYSEFPPHPLLAHVVKCFWILENNEIPNEPFKEKILPDGCTEMIFHYGDHFNRYTTNQIEKQDRSFVYGQIKKYIEIGPSGKTGLIAARFFPNGMSAFLSMPMVELTGLSVSVTDLFGKEGKVLEQKILDANSNLTRKTILEDFLISRLRNHPTDVLVASAVERIRHEVGEIRINDLAKEYDISVKQLERRFADAVGMTPKYYSRVVRFQNMFALLEKGEINSLTALAIESGYFDQAHFISEFRKFSGVNPNSYFRNDHQFSEYFTANH